MKTAWLIGTVLVLTVEAQDVFASEGVFWSWYHSDSIWQADLDGSNPQTVISGINSVMDIALDTANNKLYWTNPSWGSYRANADGTDEELIVSIENFGPSYLAVDPSRGKVFWSWYHSDSIWQADLDGSNPQTVISGINSVMDIALDTANNKLYWTNPSWGIYRANADGTDEELIVSIENFGPSYLAVDPSRGKVFWSWYHSDSIWQADLDGSNPQTVISGINSVMDIALDTANNKLYWTNPSWGIYRANADGTDEELIVSIENFGPSYLAVTPEPATLVLLALGGLRLLRRRRLPSSRS